MVNLINWVHSVDWALLNGIQSHFVHPALTGAMAFFTHLGEAGLVWIFCALVLLLRKETRRAGLAVALALLFTQFFGNTLLKNLIARPRPFTMAEIELLIAAPGGYSFPSGHTASSFAAAMAIFLWQRRFGVAAFVLAALIAFSRLYFYVHFPSDVCAGILLGLLLGFSADRLAKRLTGYPGSGGRERPPTGRR